jgi:hypothetical protein
LDVFFAVAAVDIIYSALYYFKSGVVCLDLTVENILYYFFINVVW